MYVGVLLQFSNSWTTVVFSFDIIIAHLIIFAVVPIYFHFVRWQGNDNLISEGGCNRRGIP